MYCLHTGPIESFSRFKHWLQTQICLHGIKTTLVSCSRQILHNNLSTISFSLTVITCSLKVTIFSLFTILFTQLEITTTLSLIWLSRTETFLTISAITLSWSKLADGVFLHLTLFTLPLMADWQLTTTWKPKFLKILN